MNIDKIVNAIKETVNTHKLLNDGEYARYMWQDRDNSRKMGLNEYGCADAVNILYTLNDFVTDNRSRENHIRTLQHFQHKDTGLFEEKTHHCIHTTAHCIAALELFDAHPLYPLYAFEKYFTSDGLTALLDGLDWEAIPWPQSHQGAGIYTVGKLTESVDESWEKTYFDWLWDNTDPQTGFWMKKGTGNTAPIFHHMGGSFHYFFNHEYAKKPARYPEKMIDSLLEMYENKQIGDKIGAYDNDKFGQYIGFLEVDWVYSVNRALRQTPGYRYGDCKSALRKFSHDYIDWLGSIDYKTHDGFNDLHMLFGTSCALAELQTALLGEIKTKKPLRLVLDRRPFI